MNGTFAQQTKVVGGHSLVIRIAGAALAALLAVATPAAMAAGADRRVDMSREVDRVKVENLQRWVSAGHEEWCKDAQLVAMDELRRIAPAFAGEAGDLEALPLDTEAASAERVLFAWTSPDGRATYHITVERFSWLLSIAGDEDSIVWVPTHAEIVAHR